MPLPDARSDYLSWGRVDRLSHVVARPAFTGDAGAILAALGPGVLAYGMGRSYGDSCLNGGGGLVDTRGLDRYISFDAATGMLEVEAGVTLAQILRHLGAAGRPGCSWFLPVSPGTKFVTVGGAIANDVHGKNHHAAGCFGNHVLSLRLLRSDGMVRRCSLSQEPGLFAATIGGLGLTGLMLSAVLQLKRVPSAWLEVEDVRFDTLADFDRLSAESLAAWEYTVSWIDCLARGVALGRGIFTRARHVEQAGPPPAAVLRPAWRVPFDMPSAALNSATVAAFNAVYWRRARRAPVRRVASYERVFYPLDAVGAWNRIYGARGFYQYQCVVPVAAAPDAIPALLHEIAHARQGSFLAVLKTLSGRPSPGLLSFPMPGTTLALDFPNRGTATTALLDRLDAITAAAGGRIYPAKDGRVSAAHFQRGYPNLRAFAEHIDPNFSSSFWRRVSAAAA